MTHQHLQFFAIFPSKIKLNTGKRLESEGLCFYADANHGFGNNVYLVDFPLMSALKSAPTYL